MSDLLQQEKLIDRYLKENKVESAVKLLFDLIVKNAEAKNFVRAEALREKIFEIDSMALNEIVKSAEIIEAEKIACIDPVHLDTWSRLYDTLTKEETIALYYGMKAATYAAEHIIFRQGELNSNLYFINAGQLKMFYHKGDHGILLKTIGSGDMAGEDTFFSNSICTTSLMTHSRVKLSFLEKDVLEKWQAEAPNLENKLHDYCLKLEPVKDLLNMKNLERREHKRYAISGSAVVQIIKTADSAEGKIIKADLSDISASGLSFIMNTSQKLAESLLGRKLNIKFMLHQASPEFEFDRNGTIVGVQSRLFNEYLINLKWEQMLDQDIIGKIKSIAYLE